MSLTFYVKNLGGNMSNEKIKFIYWQEEKIWIGYLEEYPDYLTQAESFEELKENLRDIFKELKGGHIPFVRKIGELEVA
jgi:predicted RNase H-like HicB family nuclease